MDMKGSVRRLGINGILMLGRMGRVVGVL